MRVHTKTKPEYLLEVRNIATRPPFSAFGPTQGGNGIADAGHDCPGRRGELHW